MRFYEPSETCQIPDLDGLYRQAFGCRTRGTFVEVGAYDGESFSNTSCLADLGWRGLYVEPVPAFAASCRARHRGSPAVAVAECAVSDRPGPARLFVGGTLSSLSAEYVAALEGIEWARGHHVGQEIEVPTERLDALLERHGISPGFDLLVVDVEGHEASVLRTLDLAVWRPRMLIVEIEDRHPDFAAMAPLMAEKRALRAAIEAAGYRLLREDVVNSVFVHASATPASAADCAAPRVSVGMPVFDGEAYVGGALDALLAQTDRDLEIVVSDNASTDRTPEIVGAYKAKDPRIRYVRRPRNFGAIDNFKHALALSNGRYFLWAAVDDRWDPRFVERLAGALDRDPGAMLAFSHFRTLNHVTGALGDLVTPVSTDREAFVRDFGLLRRPVPNLLYGVARREVVVDVMKDEPFDFDWADVWFSFAVLARGSIAIVEEDLFRAGIKETERKILAANGKSVEVGRYVKRSARLFLSRYPFREAMRLLPRLLKTAWKMKKGVRKVEREQRARARVPYTPPSGDP